MMNTPLRSSVAEIYVRRFELETCGLRNRCSAVPTVTPSCRRPATVYGPGAYPLHPNIGSAQLGEAHFPSSAQVSSERHARPQGSPSLLSA